VSIQGTNARVIARGIAALLAAAVAVSAGVLRAAEYEVPPQLQISILLKVLVYDRTLAARSRDGLNLGVVFDPKNEASRSCKDVFIRTFGESPRQLGGVTIGIVETPQENLATEADKGLDIVYVCGGTKSAAIIETAHKKGLISFAPDESAVQQGVAIGLVPRDGKPKLLINVGCSIASGMQLDPQILRLAELVR
jgi:hypothetical protein